MRHLLILALLAAPAGAQTAGREPRIGYLFPAGVSAGTTVEVIAAGQNLRAAKRAWVSGPGVGVEVVESYRPIRNINGEQRRELMFRVDCRRAELEGRERPKPPRQVVADREARRKDPADELEPVPLPPHPVIDRLGELTGRELEHFVTTTLSNNQRRQLNTQLAELVLLRVTADADAAPGRREIRLLGPAGLTNPLAFEVSRVAEIREFEPNDPGARPKAPPLPAAEPPFVLNGQVMPGDVDRFRFRARRGQPLVVEAHARSLVPYLADAVPGWFQVVVALLDPDGRELAWADDFRFNPDPVLFFEAPRDGEYQLEIRDSIYRGREDFVYRLRVGEQPLVTGLFPLGAREGSTQAAELRGWNLPARTLSLDTSPSDTGVRVARLFRGPLAANPVPYAVGTLPETTEAEPNDSHEQAQPVALPQVINGRIGRPGEVDTYRFDGRAGQQLVAEVTARRLNSPLDSLLRLTDRTGETLAWNDDRMDKDGDLHLGAGLLTHHADSYLHATLPTDGPWFVTVSDAQHQGGPAHAYRLRLSDALPGFELKVTPSAVNVAPGGHAPIEVHVLRSDGYQGPIDLFLDGAPEGFGLSGARIPAGCDRLQLTLAAPPEAPAKPLTLRLAGRAQVGGRTVVSPALPADDTMQAFLWRHLVPADEWLVWVGPPKNRRPPVALAGPLPVRVPAGGSAEVGVTVAKWMADRKLEFQPVQLPEGLSLSEPRKTRNGLAFRLSAADDKPAAGLAGNLVIEAVSVTQPKGKPAQRWPVGHLPAIPYKVVDPAPADPPASR